MKKGIIEVDPRHTTRRIRTAMQGNIIRALVELITNADDSYIKLEDAMRLFKEESIIEILYRKEGRCGIFAVRDYAEGMSERDVENNFRKYGAATSGFQMGKKVRGYFGQGGTDALAGMEDGRICTFKDDIFTECRLFIENQKPSYEIDDPITATQEMRNRHNIWGNGTIAYFKKNVPVPRFDTVREDLANNYLLRKIMTNSQRKVLIINEDTEESYPLRYHLPQGKDIFTDNFTISCENYGEFPISLSLWRSETELTQDGDDRVGGLLIIDDENVVLDITLFKYDSEPLAKHFFGEVKIRGFRRLLEKEEAVLSEERDGLAKRHPFYKDFKEELEKRIELKIKEERLRKDKEDQTKIDREETARYKKAFSILNKIAKDETQDITPLGKSTTDEKEEPPNGFCLYPSSAEITVNKRYAFELRVNTSVIPHGSIINVRCNNPKIRVLVSEIDIRPQDETGILSKYITVEGTEPNIEGKLIASTGNNSSEARIFVIQEKEIFLEEGMIFSPETITLRPNKVRKVYLSVYIKIIKGGSTINIISDNPLIHISKGSITINEFDAIRHVAKYELDVWGEGEGQDALITAGCGEYMALLEVKIRAIDRPPQERGGMFNEPEFNYEPEPNQRISYSAETGKVIIYVNFPSVKHYLGEECQFRKSLPAQILLADLMAERAFYEIAKKKVESSGTLITPESKYFRIQREAFDFSRKHGKKIHEALVDQNLLMQFKKIDEDFR